MRFKGKIFSKNFPHRLFTRNIHVVFIYYNIMQGLRRHSHLLKHWTDRLTYNVICIDAKGWKMSFRKKFHRNKSSMWNITAIFPGPIWKLIFIALCVVTRTRFRVAFPRFFRVSAWIFRLFLRENSGIGVCLCSRVN